MFSIRGGTETRRLPGRFQVPWKEIGLAAIILIVLAVLALGAEVLYSNLTGGESVAPAVSQPAVVPANPQIPQNVQENVGAVVPVVVDYRVTWTEVRGFDPSTIPVEEGFYNGAFPQPKSVSLGPNGPDPVLEGDAFVWKILPELKGIWGINVAATRDQIDKNVVFVSIVADHTPSWYILLSVDGEQSWCTLNLLPLWVNGYQQGDTAHPRVVAQGEEIHLYGLDVRPGIHWWEAVVKKSALPCS